MSVSFQKNTHAHFPSFRSRGRFSKRPVFARFCFQISKHAIRPRHAKHVKIVTKSSLRKRSLKHTSCFHILQIEVEEGAFSLFLRAIDTVPPATTPLPNTEIQKWVKIVKTLRNFDPAFENSGSPRLLLISGRLARAFSRHSTTRSLIQASA